MKNIIYAILSGLFFGLGGSIFRSLYLSQKAKTKKAKQETKMEKVKSQHLEQREKEKPYTQKTRKEIDEEWQNL